MKICLVTFIPFVVGFFPDSVKQSKLAVFGAQGRTGKYVVNKSLDWNIPVVSLVRNHHSIESTSDHIIYKGDVTNYKDVYECYNNHDISGTIVCLGGDTSSVGKTMLTNGTKNIIKAIKETDASKRIAIVTSIGSGNSVDDPPFFFKVLMNTLLKDAFVDKNNQESLFLDETEIGHDLEYTIVRPGGLTNEDESGIGIVNSGSGSIPRASVANFCFNAIYDKNFSYLKKPVSITSFEKSTNSMYFKSMF